MKAEPADSTAPPTAPEVQQPAPPSPPARDEKGKGISQASKLQVNLKKGPWSAEEDEILLEHVRNHGEGNWNSVRKNSGLARCGKSCRLRWTNHLRPNLKKGLIEPDEELIITRLHSQFGNKWAKISTYLPGRTDNEIKNYWNTRIKRQRRASLPLYPPEIQPELSVRNQLNPSPSNQILRPIPITIPHHQSNQPYGFNRLPSSSAPPSPLSLRQPQAAALPWRRDLYGTTLACPFTHSSPVSPSEYRATPAAVTLAATPAVKAELPSTQFSQFLSTQAIGLGGNGGGGGSNGLSDPLAYELVGSGKNNGLSDPSFCGLPSGDYSGSSPFTGVKMIEQHRFVPVNNFTGGGTLFDVIHAQRIPVATPSYVLHDPYRSSSADVSSSHSSVLSEEEMQQLISIVPAAEPLDPSWNVNAPN